MKKFNITVERFDSITDWVLTRETMRDEDNRTKFVNCEARGETPQVAAKNYFDKLIADGGSIIRLETDSLTTGILLNGKVYECAMVWYDHRSAECFRPRHFFE